MSKGGNITASQNAPLFAWLGPLAGLAELGTEGYPRPARRQMAIVNLMAALIAVFSAIYAVVFALYGVDTYLHLIVANLLLVAVALLVPLAHRISDIAGALLVAVAEFAALFYFVRALGHDSGIQINYIVAAAVAFAICGISRFRLTLAVIVTGLALHLAAWFLYPPERAMIAAPPELLTNLYVSSAITTFAMISLVVGYAFTLADRARAEADALLANILPEAIAERLKERPSERVADSIANASVLFSDLVGFTELAKDLGAARTVALLDQVVTEFDRLAAAHGVEKIKTTGDGYMAVAGVSQPQDDHLKRLACMALKLPDLVEQLSVTNGVDLRIRIGIASGPVMAGVIGTDKFSYDVWGETVNLASRLESHGLPGEIQVCGDCTRVLGPHFVLEPRGAIQVKGVGEIETWLLKEERGSGRNQGAASA
jgi:adenylate cyclase